jgi:hypothetical protein
MKLNSLLMATLLLGIGLGIGYGLGRWQGRATGETARITTGQQPQNPGDSTASSNHPTNPQRRTKPAATAKGLLHAMLHNHSKGGGEDPVGRVHFRQAVSQCDEATLSDLIEELRKASAEDPRDFSLGHSEAPAWCQLMVERIATLAPMKAIEALIGLKAAEFSFLDQDLELIFSNLAQQDPSQVPTALAKMEVCEMRSDGERAWLLTQTKTDPNAVFQFLMGRQDKASMSRDDLEAVAERLGLYAPEKALTVVQEYDDKGNRDRLLASVMASWSERDPSSAYSYAMAQKDAALLLPCLKNPLFVVDYAALRQAFPELKSSNPEARPILGDRIAKDLAEKDINAARQWAATLPPADQAEANTAIVKTWIENDPVAASEWLATWPTGKAKESAADHLIGKIYLDDPERALTWATNCLQGSARYSALAEIMVSFAAKDPNTAAAARAALSEEDRTLLSSTEKNPPNVRDYKRLPRF